MEQRQRLRRLADLGVEGHQPAIAAYVKMSEQEKERVALSIISQKVGANPKQMRSYEEHLKRSKEETQEDVEHKKKKRKGQSETKGNGRGKGKKMTKKVTTTTKKGNPATYGGPTRQGS